MTSWKERNEARKTDNNNNNETTASTSSTTTTTTTATATEKNNVKLPDNNGVNTTEYFNVVIGWNSMKRRRVTDAGDVAIPSQRGWFWPGISHDNHQLVCVTSNLRHEFSPCSLFSLFSLFVFSFLSSFSLFFIIIIIISFFFFFFFFFFLAVHFHISLSFSLIYFWQ